MSPWDMSRAGRTQAPVLRFGYCSACTGIRKMTQSASPARTALPDTGLGPLVDKGFIARGKTLTSGLIVKGS